MAKLDDELKQRYIEAIHIMWPSPDIEAFTADSVTEDVATFMDSLFERIASCSAPIAGVEQMFKNFYAPFNVDKWSDILKKSFKVFKNWMKTLRKQRKYIMCINNVAASARMEIRLKLQGIY